MRVNSKCAHQLRPHQDCWPVFAAGRVGETACSLRVVGWSEVLRQGSSSQRSRPARIRKPDFLIDSIFVDGARSGDVDSCGALQTHSSVATSFTKLLSSDSRENQRRIKERADQRRIMAAESRWVIAHHFVWRARLPPEKASRAPAEFGHVSVATSASRSAASMNRRPTEAPSRRK